MKDDKNRDLNLRVPVPYHDVSSGYLLNKWAGLPAYDDVAALVALATTFADALDAAWKDSYAFGAGFMLCLKCNSSDGHTEGCVVARIQRARRAAGRIP